MASTYDHDDFGIPKSKTIHQLRIEEFMRLAGQDVPKSPTIPSEDVRLLRAKLILEEAIETIGALGFQLSEKELQIIPYGECNILEVMDGCADISVVTIGTLSAFGVSDYGVLTEVDNANLRKFEPGSYKREDGKWVKPPNWTGPDIQGILEQQSRASTGN